MGVDRRPLCQAYMGRARNSGRRDVKFLTEREERQKLYIEYLQVIADHSPAAFS